MTSEHDDDKTRLNAGEDDATRVEGAETGAGDRAKPGQIGAYRLIRELGSGGMGQVFLAEQTEPVQREVALKLINQADSAIASVFFEVERQILARLHHPAIAQIYDAGTSEQGAPWFAMELVDGEPVNAHCERYELSREQRLRLFIRICQGVQHAHQRGVIHRDLKPGNILVARIDGQSVPKIIDFGVATSVSRPPSASVDQLQGGTPVYMSPEQLGETRFGGDARSDVFSLGVVLFELLLGCRPPRGDDETGLKDVRSVLLQGRSTISGSTSLTLSLLAPQDREQVVRLTRRLPFELRCILARALAILPEDRYASADALAADLDAFLQDRPVSAVPATRGYLLRKFLWRHRVPVGFAASLAAAVVIGLVVAVWGLVQAQAQRDVARMQAERAEQTVSFMRQMLSSIDPDFALGADTALMERVLEDAADRVERELSSQPGVAAEILHVVGSTYLAIGEFQSAEAPLRRAKALADAAERRELEWMIGLDLAARQRNIGALEEAERTFSQLIDEAGQLGLQDDPRLIDMRLGLAEVHVEAGRRERALEIAEPLVAELTARDDPQMLMYRLDGQNVMARAYQDLGEYDKAEAAYRATIEAAENADQPRLRRHVSNSVNSLAVLKLQQQSPELAEPLLRRAIALTEQRLGTDDSSLLLPMVSNLASSLRQQGKMEQAGEAFQRALALSLKHFGEDSPSTLVVRYNMGNLYRELGDVQQALALHQTVYDKLDAAFPESHPVHGMSRLGLGRSLYADGQYAAAIERLEEAVALLTEFYGADYHRTLEASDYLQRAREGLAGEG